MRALPWLAFVALPLACACKGSSSAGPVVDAARVESSAIEAAAPTASDASPVDAHVFVASAPPLAPLPLDGGAGCHSVLGPVALPLKSAAALEPRTDDMVEAIQNDDGRPRNTTIRRSLRDAAAGETGAGGYGVPCAIAGDHNFCSDHTGAVHRSGPDGDHLVASSRTGSRIAAGLVGGAHPMLAYLASRQTSEGWVSEAWGTVDDDAPVRLSEDGSGATAVTLVERGSSLLAVYVDSRAALTGMHARPIALEGGHLKLAEDAVVFVGGPGDRRTAGTAVVPATGPAWGLLPIGKDATTFGLAVVRLDDPPHVDEPVVWSMYPNGLDPAPTAATAEGGTTWIARVVPRDASVGAQRLLEMGIIDASGQFASAGVVPTASHPTDLALAAAPNHYLWLAWVDSTGSWLEDLECKPPAGLPARDH